MGPVPMLRNTLAIRKGVGALRSDSAPRKALHPALKPVDLLRGVAKLGHLDGLADVFRAQDYFLGDIARQVRVLAQLAGDDLLSHFKNLLLGVELEVETDEPGEELG